MSSPLNEMNLSDVAKNLAFYIDGCETDGIIHTTTTTGDTLLVTATDADGEKRVFELNIREKK